jgi:hypothetical protein
MNAHRLRAPLSDGELLAEPPLERAANLLAANAGRLATWEHDFQGRSASRLRSMVRGQVLDRARTFLASAGLDAPGSREKSVDERVVVTGHQPELFHPGVWVKNFATAEVARQAGGLGLNLIVDNDIPKSTETKAPRIDGDALRVERVPFDGWAGELPYEDLCVSDEALFASFPDRLRAVLGGAIADPIVEEFWPRALEFREHTRRLGLRFALARRAVEASWGVHNLEVPLSQVCETEGFAWFASHLLAHLPRFQTVHNDALQRYRALYGIRSKHHPVPALRRQGDWLEAPFWIWRGGEPRRRPLMARQRGRSMELRIGGENEPLMELPLAADREACCAVDQLLGLPAQGVRLRTRALTTTMFARYLLGDLFLHGIGGAKYDELGDEISARFLGIAAPDYLTISMTLRLGLRDDPASPARLAEVGRELRDLTFNPDRHLDAPTDPETARLVEAKRKAIAGPVESHAQRLERFHEIRRCNAALQKEVEARRVMTRQEQARLLAGVQRNARARSRDYAFILHSRSRLREALSRSLPGLRFPVG